MSVVHDMSLDGLHVTCTCGELDTCITDETFYLAVAQRHSLHLGVWPFEQPLGEKYDGWPENEKENDD